MPRLSDAQHQAVLDLLGELQQQTERDERARTIGWTVACVDTEVRSLTLNGVYTYQSEAEEVARDWGEELNRGNSPTDVPFHVFVLPVQKKVGEV